MPNRILNEKIRTSKQINAMNDFQFRLWTYLLTYVDDYGRGSADTQLLKGFVFPRRNVREQDIQGGLEALERNGSILLYSVAGEPYLCFPTWQKYQRVQTKISKFPEPGEEDMSRWLTVNHGEPPPESNPIQSNPESRIQNPESNQEDRGSAFEMFWESYPKKVGKAAAKKAFARVNVDVGVLIDAVNRHKLSSQWCRDGGMYIPNPATWLNQERWNDQLDTNMGRKVPAGASGILGDAELEAIRRVLREEGA